MKQRFSREKVKPFRLVKYFTFTSLVVIFFGTVVLAVSNTRWARSLQLTKSEDYALVLVENLNHQVFLQFIIPTALKYGKIQLRDQEQFEHLDRVVRSTLHSFRVETVNIYDMNNTIAYSYDEKVIGKQNVGGTGYQNAVGGRTTSKLIQRGNFLRLALGFPEASRLITFAPLRAERTPSRISGPVIGVVEIVQDLSQDDRTVFHFQVVVILTCSIIMAALFLTLLLVVKRGERIIEERAQERLRLKEELSRSRHLSALGEMVATISHEIRNPLGIIRSSAELLKKRMATDGNGIPDIIVEESSRLNHIITDFLNFARPRSPEFEPCRIEEILEKNIAFLESQSRESGHSIYLKAGNGLPPVMADPEMLYQAFLNLLMNAMQAMPSGGQIHIDLEAGPAGIRIEIRDQGPGIPEEILDKVWDPFFTTKEKGTGLGLGVVQKIVEAHQGRIAIGNLGGGGAKISVDLPLGQEDSHGNRIDR